MLRVNNITFKYTENPVLSDLSFAAKKGEHISIIGASGSGKTTLLKLLYGECDLEFGTIFWNNYQILGPKYNLVVGFDFMKYVSQEFDLMPHTTVEENVGKFVSNFDRDYKKRRVGELLELVELTAFSTTKVKVLSGGQKQRVALAQAIATKPEIILLDEPFSHIDNHKKLKLRKSVFDFLKNEGITCIMATHDKDDVLGFTDRMIVLEESKIIANNSPKHLYNNPETPLVASFFGEFNVIESKIVYANQLKVVEISNLKVTVRSSYFKGHFYLIEADFNDKTILFEHPNSIDKGQVVYLEIRL